MQNADPNEDAVSLLLFYYAMMADQTYYHAYFVRTGRQIAFTVFDQILGTVMVLASRANVYGVIIGLLVTSSSQLVSLLKTYLAPRKDADHQRCYAIGMKCY